MTLISRLLFAILILSSCASNGLTDVERTALYQNYVSENKLEQVRSIYAFRFNGWRELGKEHLIIFTSISKPYKIKNSLKRMKMELTVKKKHLAFGFIILLILFMGYNYMETEKTTKVKLETSAGDIVIELNAAAAPK